MKLDKSIAGRARMDEKTLKALADACSGLSRQEQRNNAEVAKAVVVRKRWKQGGLLVKEA